MSTIRACGGPRSPLFPVLAVPLLLYSIFILPSHAQSLEWEIEGVDCPRQFDNLTDRSLRLDAGGHPHLVYGGENLYYAYAESPRSVWRLETVDKGSGVGHYAALFIDEHGFPHISYSGRGLRYAYRDESGWHVEVAVSMVTGWTSIALDSSGFPHIAFRASGLWCARKDAAGWHAQQLDYPGNVNKVSIAVDDSGYAHIAYGVSSGSGNHLKYACEDGSGWHIEVVDGAATEGAHPSLALDGSGGIGICYADQDYLVRYAFRDPAGWQYEMAGGGGSGIHTSLAFDGDGYPHVSSRSPSWSLRHSYKDESGWRHETLCTGVSGNSTSIAIDASGRVRIGYQDDHVHGLMYASKHQSAWGFETVDAGGWAGKHASIALDAVGKPHIAYCAGIDHSATAATTIRYAWRREPRSRTSPDARTWTTATVDSGYDTGWNSSLAIDPAGIAHIGYRGRGLFYATGHGAGWRIETVDSGNETGHGASLVLDELGFPRISHADQWDDVLKLAYKDATGWNTVSLETDYHEGGGSLAVDGDNFAHVSYSRGGHLACAFEDPTGWHAETVDADPNVGGYSSMEIDEQGFRHISYYEFIWIPMPEPYDDIFDGNLRYAYEDVGGWHVQIVDALGDAGRYTSLELDQSRFPHIAYVRNGAVKYASLDPTGWSISALPGAGLSEWTSLALDASGRPHIAYYDRGGDDLMYAHLAGPSLLHLSATLSEQGIILTWSPMQQASGFWVYGASNLPWFVPGGAPGYGFRLEVLPWKATMWSSPNGVGTPDANWTYLVMAVDAWEQELARSRRVGEAGFGADLPCGIGVR